MTGILGKIILIGADDAAVSSNYSFVAGSAICYTTKCDDLVKSRHSGENRACGRQAGVQMICNYLKRLDSAKG